MYVGICKYICVYMLKYVNIYLYIVCIYTHIYIYMHIKIRVNNNIIHKHIFCVFNFSHRYKSCEHFYFANISGTQHLLGTHGMISNPFLRHDKACFCHLGDSARDDASVGLQHSGRRGAHIAFHCVCFTCARLLVWCEVC